MLCAAAVFIWVILSVVFEGTVVDVTELGACVVTGSVVTAGAVVLGGGIAACVEIKPGM